MIYSYLPRLFWQPTVLKSAIRKSKQKPTVKKWIKRDVIKSLLRLEIAKVKFKKHSVDNLNFYVFIIDGKVSARNSYKEKQKTRKDKNDGLTTRCKKRCSNQGNN